MSRLCILLEGRIVATATQDSQGGLSMTYEEVWRESEDAYPISLSMPLARREHGDEVVRPFLEGLLPDNAQILEKWARRFSVSARNPFALLRHVGEDCAGAIQLVALESVEDVLGRGGSVEWLSEGDIALRIARLREDNSAWRTPEDLGTFSLPGAQAKTALYLREGRWGVPSGPTPTTHILKPPLPEFEGFVENEHLTLELARTCGLPAASSEVVVFGDEVAIVVERFDRVILEGEVRRIHQEDFCQALGVSPIYKYEADSGPNAGDLIRVLRERASDPGSDVSRLLDALIFNWLVGGTDGHAKNYSITLAADGLVALSPLYDLATAAPYPLQVPWQKMRLAMKLGGEYRMRWIRPRHLDRLGDLAGLEAGRVKERAQQLGELMLDRISDVRDEGLLGGLEEVALRRWADSLAEHVPRCLRLLSASASNKGSHSG